MDTYNESEQTVYETLIGEWTPDRPTLEEIERRVGELAPSNPERIIQTLRHYYSR